MVVSLCFTALLYIYIHDIFNCFWICISLWILKWNLPQYLQSSPCKKKMLCMTWTGVCNSSPAMHILFSLMLRPVDRIRNTTNTVDGMTSTHIHPINVSWLTWLPVKIYMENTVPGVRGKASRFAWSWIHIFQVIGASFLFAGNGGSTENANRFKNGNLRSATVCGKWWVACFLRVASAVSLVFSTAEEPNCHTLLHGKTFTEICVCVCWAWVRWCWIFAIGFLIVDI